MTLESFVNYISLLDKTKEYSYISSIGTDKKTFKIDSVSDNQIKVVRGNKVIPVSINSIDKILQNLKIDKPNDIENILGGSGSDRSIIEALFCLTPNIFYGKIDNRKKIFYTLSKEHELGIMVEHIFDDTDISDIEIKESEDENTFSRTDLTKILQKMFTETEETEHHAAVQIFGFKYCKIIEQKEIDTSKIIQDSGIGDEYNSDIIIGMNFYKSFSDKKYGISINRKVEKYSSIPIIKPHNRIIFGAPGTGKSFQIDKDLKDKTGADNFIYYERVTFHPSYSYANFVGTYKPVKDEKNNGQITYEFVEGPFIRVLRQALCDTKENNYLLIIEEINRANVTAVFGDVFQLLDRDSENCSQYFVASSEDLRKHLIKHGVPNDKAEELRIPSNMYIWATMNSADQGVQPLDTAFKRRWEFEYLNIDNSENKIDENMKSIKFPKTSIDWNLLRHLINNRLSSNYNINEDKLLGPFFVKKGKQNETKFISSFKSKVLMYLFEDVCKINPKPLFAGIDKSKLYFSDIVSAFDTSGIDIFKFSDDEVKQAEEEIKEKQADE